MAFTSPVFTAVTGGTILASQHNTYVRDNIAAIWVGTTAGDIDYYTGATAKSRLAIGTAYQFLQTNAGATAPVWASSVIKRQGGSATDWYSQGTTDYSPGAALIQTGTRRVAVSGTPGNGSAAVTFGQAFSYKPTVFITKPYDGAQVNDIGFTSLTASGFSIFIAYAGAASINVDCNWLAIGPP